VKEKGAEVGTPQIRSASSRKDGRKKIETGEDQRGRSAGCSGLSTEFIEWGRYGVRGFISLGGKRVRTDIYFDRMEVSLPKCTNFGAPI